MNEEEKIALNNRIAELEVQIESIGYELVRKLGSGALSSRSIADRFVARKAGISGAGTATTDIRFWAGKLYPDRATAPFRVDDAGKMVASTVAISQTIVNIGGTGADGALSISSGTTTIDLGSAPLVTKNYTSISITGTGVLAFSNPYSGGTIIILKSQGAVTITSTATRAIDCRSLGATAGAGGAGATPTGEDGVKGTNTFAVVDASAHYGGGGDEDNSNAGGTAGAQITVAQVLYARTAEYVRYLGRVVLPGSGGGGAEGGGGTNSGGAGGGGGRGAGAMIIESAGAYNVTGTIDLGGTNGVAGTNGTASDSGGGGGGGGGAGGMFLAIYNTLTADSGTYTVTAGSGGSGGTGLGSGTGGYGGGGAGTTEAAGTAGSAFATSTGGAGGAGADGIALRILNTF